MADWILVPCLVKLRSEFNTAAPNRDKASDGTIGDTAHAAGGNSDHLPDEHYAALRNKDTDATPEVHAIDVDSDLRQPGLTMEIVVQRILKRCRSGAEKRLRYIIWNRRIWEASNGWQQRPYQGSNPHDHHAHFSASYTTALEASTASWQIGAPAVATLDADDKTWLSAEIKKQVKACIADFWVYDIGKATGNVSQSARGALFTANVRAGNVTNSQMPKLTTAVAQLAAKQIDPAALIGALVPALTDAVVASLPADRDDVTADELKEAIVAAARDLIA
ncbi:hypothetical protein Ade02nite_19900 [Paractinoplanes deccanensis]|uniref:Uncharacterized protein n=1 Tax=Paractinoplanes deccanensis TaxID=113561 RepID=A0ABQ3Y037_9ACTN|nr:hypothetical protein [Actinoplanes deccanensis]GID73349.1 hypothetical protein Ade02nite_19900 [Actinoplanes deccanensis]